MKVTQENYKDHPDYKMLEQSVSLNGWQPRPFNPEHDEIAYLIAKEKGLI